MSRAILAAFTAYFVLLLLAHCGVGGEEPAASSSLPGYILEVRVGGNSYEVRDGVPASVRVGQSDVEMTVRVLPEKQFNADGMKFLFPTEMAVERQVEEEVTAWILDGEDVKIALIVSTAELDSHLVEDIVLRNRESLAGLASDIREKPASLRLGGKDVSGTELTYSVVGQARRQVIVSLAVPSGSAVLTFHEPGPGGAPEESSRVRGLLDRTIEIVPR
jgi:hypothetical protein